MAMKYKEVGGGPATGLANDFVSFLQNGLQTGSFGSAGATSQAAGANPIGSTNGIGGILNDLLAGGAGVIGGNMASMISKQSDRDVNALRARSGLGGASAFGTPASYAEAQLRSDTAPKLVNAIGGLQQGVLSQLLPLFANLSSKGIAQREGTYQENPWATAAQIGLTGAGTALGFMAGGPGGAAVGNKIGSSAGGMFGGGPGAAPPSFDPSFFSAPSTQQMYQNFMGYNQPPASSPFGFTPSFRYQ